MYDEVAGFDRVDFVRRCCILPSIYLSIYATGYLPGGPEILRSRVREFMSGISRELVHIV